MKQMAGVRAGPTSGRRDLADLRVCCSGTSRRVDSKRPQLSVLTQRLTLVRARIPRSSPCATRGDNTASAYAVATTRRVRFVCGSLRQRASDDVALEAARYAERGQEAESVIAPEC